MDHATILIRLIRFPRGIGTTTGLRVGRDVLLRGIVEGASRSPFRKTNSQSVLEQMYRDALPRS